MSATVMMLRTRAPARRTPLEALAEVARMSFGRTHRMATKRYECACDRHGSRHPGSSCTGRDVEPRLDLMGTLCTVYVVCDCRLSIIA